MKIYDDLIFGVCLVNGKVNSPKPGGGARSFTFKELAAATKNFREVNMIGKGGFGSVYRGRLDSGQVSKLTSSVFNHKFFLTISNVVRNLMGID